MVRMRDSRPMLCLLSLIVGVEGHVSMIYQDGQPAGIRNANTETGNGRASVQTPCGGATNFGANGVGTMSDGDTVTLALRYAAGHNGNFRFAYACGGGSGTALEPAAARVGPVGYDATDPTAGCTVTGASSEYPLASGGATAVGQNTMTFTCKLPSKVPAGGAAQDCTLAILDQRDWAGCVDVNVLSAADPLPPSPPPAPFVPSTGTYAFTEAGKVDTAAGQKASGLFTCCALGGSLTVPPYAQGSPEITATFNAEASGCPASAPGDPPFTDPPPPNTGTYGVSTSMTMVASDDGYKYTGSTLMAGQPFEFVVSSGDLAFTNTGGAQPIICDGISSLNARPDSGQNLSRDDTASVSLSSVALGLVVVGLGVAAYLYFKRKRETDSKPPSSVITMTAPPPGPPPPGPPPGGLPNGWTANLDPASGVQYYFNAATGQSSWERPTEKV